MSRDPRLYLEDMQTACRKIVNYTFGMVRQDFLQDDKTYDAVIRNLEIIGEAAKNVPEEIQKRYSNIQWREMIALRNMVAHAYFGMNDDIIWDLIQNKVPELFTLITQVMSEMKSDH
jgi:uncharacterized protein with HEPN domain